ncbi:hypothetical protein [Lactococcus lactis]|nr:hypothetical protein [Lactococcus lactis]MDG4972417.1 hypothetical protein [Lactococcus lactis]MDT2887912.1 hypothetical protein [Lactococcus lactis]MDT2930692.1 hypothetical protein [Lactococcus lactis]
MTDEKMNALGFVGLTDDEWTNIWTLNWLLFKIDFFFLIRC